MGRNTTKEAKKPEFVEFNLTAGANTASGRAFIESAETTENGARRVPLSLTINGLAIRGAKWIKSTKATFISLPQYKKKDGSYESLIYFYEEEDVKFLKDLADEIATLI